MINGKMLAQTYFGVEFANRALIYIIPKADNTALPAAGNTDWLCFFGSPKAVYCNNPLSNKTISKEVATS